MQVYLSRAEVRFAHRLRRGGTTSRAAFAALGPRELVCCFIWRRVALLPVLGFAYGHSALRAGLRKGAAKLRVALLPVVEGIGMAAYGLNPRFKPVAVCLTWHLSPVTQVHWRMHFAGVKDTW